MANSNGLTPEQERAFSSYFEFLKTIRDIKHVRDIHDVDMGIFLTMGRNQSFAPNDLVDEVRKANGSDKKGTFDLSRYEGLTLQDLCHPLGGEKIDLQKMIQKVEDLDSLRREISEREVFSYGKPTIFTSAARLWEQGKLYKGAEGKKVSFLLSPPGREDFEYIISNLKSK